MSLSFPTVIPGNQHSISLQQIDPDALKVLHRLQRFDYASYLVGGSVRDLLLGRFPKDFDIGTSAHPSQVKRLFRNCWIIGRRFRLAHIKFGLKTIEVATFRSQALQLWPPKSKPSITPDHTAEKKVPKQRSDELYEHRSPTPIKHGLGKETRHPFSGENTFGTAEEDAFRRDFTINALFYDVSTSSITDYVGGLHDLKNRLIRCIGDPDERFPEDPVRMLRAVALAVRLQFKIDPPTYKAIRRHRATITQSSPTRLLEEVYKILRSGVSNRTFRMLDKTGLLNHISPELTKHQTAVLWHSLEKLDLYRGQFGTAPATLTTPILLGTLLVPAINLERHPFETDGSRITLGILPLAHRHVRRLRQIVRLQRRMLDAELSYGTQRKLMSRDVYHEAFTWLEIHEHSSEAIERWRALGKTAGAHLNHLKAKSRRRRSSKPLTHV